MAIIDGEGTALGSSIVFGGATVRFFIEKSFSGRSNVVVSGGVSYISTGIALGSSYAGVQLQEVSAALSGASFGVTTSTLIKNGRSSALGSSFARFAQALPALGSSAAAAHAEVTRPPPPVNANLCQPKSFNWLQLLQKGDLPIYFTEFSGGGIEPVWVRYSYFQILQDGSLKRVGGQDSVPASAGGGGYYATGLAGESGQPGNWLIEWRYQVSSSSPVCVASMPFRVLDSVMVNSPRSQLDRKIKFGWN